MAHKLRKRLEMEKSYKSEEEKQFVMEMTVVIYFLIILVMVFLTLHFEKRGGPFLIQSSGYQFWLKLLIFANYGLPLVFGVMAGTLLRPFWITFRNYLLIVILLHGAYSFFVYAIRSSLYEEWEQNIYLSQLASLKLKTFKLKTIDRNEDGIVDWVKITSALDMTDFPEGTYLSCAYLSQNGQRVPGGILKPIRFSLKKEKAELLNADFTFAPVRYDRYFAQGALEVNLSVKKIISVNEEAKRIQTLCRFAAFYRPVSWAGEDPFMSDRILELAELTDVKSISIYPVKNEYPVWIKFLSQKEEAKDADGDFYLDELALRWRVFSEYEGELFLTLFFDEKPLKTQSQSIERGEGVLHYTIDSPTIRNHEKEGPFKIFLTVQTDDPSCKSDHCLQDLRQSLTEFYEGEVAGYQRNQFASAGL